jgi:hypothetical protein
LLILEHFGRFSATSLVALFTMHNFRFADQVKFGLSTLRYAGVYLWICLNPPLYLGFIPSRVTRMGGFPPMERMFILGSFKKVAQFLATFFCSKTYLSILIKMG